MLADTSLDVDATDSSGWTALMYAAQAGRLDAVKMLIDHRADVLRRSNAGETAMSAAVSSTEEPNPQEKVRTLWTAGLNINAADNRGVTPLMLAAERLDMPSLVAAMMKLGADPTKRDVDGNNALDYAKAQDGYGPMTAMLVESMRQLLQIPATK
jgi:ankyrin repeat protein